MKNTSTQFALLAGILLASTSAFASGSFSCKNAAHGTITVSVSNQTEITWNLDSPADSPRPKHLNFVAALDQSQSTNGPVFTRITQNQREGGLKVGDIVGTDQKVYSGQVRDSLGRVDRITVELLKRNVTHNGTKPVLQTNFAAHVSSTSQFIGLNDLWNQAFICNEF